MVNKDEFEKWLESQWDDENDDSIMVSCGKQEMLREVFAKYRSIRASAVEVEPLAVLADRKGYEAVNIIPPTGVVKEWDIELLRGYEDGDGVELEKTITAPTYAECEAQARAYLEGLEDKGEPK